MNSVRWINLVIGLIVLAAVLNIAWTLMHGWGADPSSFVSFAFTASLLVLVFTVIGVSANWHMIVDFIRVRVPPVVHDEVAGDLTYCNGIWRGERLLWLEGRRRGPDPELVAAGSRAVSDAPALEARARAFAVAERVPVEHIGVLNGIRPYRLESRIMIVLEFLLTNNADDILDVTFRDGEPVEADVH